ncbi:hypothetical protein A2U01_0062921, partial [Trifolium medium]|nr:hypothetical protein [Trifolium medium]
KNVLTDVASLNLTYASPSQPHAASTDSNEVPPESPPSFSNELDYNTFRGGGGRGGRGTIEEAETHMFSVRYAPRLVTLLLIVGINLISSTMAHFHLKHLLLPMVLLSPTLMDTGAM